MDRIAVVNTTEIISQGLSSFTLFFDKLSIPDFPYVSQSLEMVEEELNLKEQGIMPETERYLGLGYYLSEAEDAAVIRGSSLNTKQVIDNLYFLLEKGLLFGVKDISEDVSWHKRLLINSIDWNASRIETALKLNMGHDVSLQIIKSSDQSIQATEVPNTFDRYGVANLVFKSLPVPSDNLPLNEVISFKEDKDVKADLARFRGWVTKMTKEHSNLADVEDEFLDAYHSYKKSIQRLDKKFSTTGWGIVMNVATEVIDNLSQLKFGTAIKSLFDFKSAHLEYDEKLDSLKGNELAFIRRLENSFPK